jgi:hypothetical protein
LNLWKVQNTYWAMLRDVLPGYRERAAGGDAHAREWIEHFFGLGESLQFCMEHLHHEITREWHEQRAA